MRAELKIFVIFVFLTTLHLNTPMVNADQIYADKQLLGRVENVILGDKNLSLDAKLDTGATMSSLSAQDIKILKLDNKILVQFTLSSPSLPKITLVAPLYDYTRILKRSEENKRVDQIKINGKEYAIRPVILLPVCLGNKKLMIKLNLVDRGQFRYPMLLGRDALRQFNAIVDVSRTHLSKTKCD